MMTASDLQDLMVRSLVRKAGGTQRRWRMVIGPVRVRDIATHPHCNWSVDPSGDWREVAEVERLVDQVTLDHAIVAAD